MALKYTFEKRKRKTKFHHNRSQAELRSKQWLQFGTTRKLPDPFKRQNISS